MRILLASEDIPYPSMGGLALHVMTLARALVQAGHQVDLLGGRQHPLASAGAEGEFGGHFFGELEGHLAGWKERRLGMFLPPRRSWQARRFARAILRRADGYDVVHYHGHLPNLAFYIPRRVNFVQTRHDQGGDCLMHTRFRAGEICEALAPAACAGCASAAPNGFQRAVSAWAVQRFRDEVAHGMRRHKTLFVSDSLRQNLVRTLGPAAQGVTLHHFIDRRALDAARAAADPPSQQDSLQLMVAGKLTPAKGIAEFLALLAPVLPLQMRLTVAGDGPLEAGLRDRYAGLPQIHFTGWCSRAATLQMTAGSHAVIVPSLWEEPFGSTVLEGLLLGKPTFALARGGIPELAVYARAPGQLRLFAGLPALVDDLVAQIRFADYGAAPAGMGSAAEAVNTLLAVYRQPPGRLLQAEPDAGRRTAWQP